MWFTFQYLTFLDFTILPAVNENTDANEDETILRIMTWNLDRLSKEKARNPGVVNVVAKLLAKHQIKVAIIYGVADPNSLSEVL